MNKYRVKVKYIYADTVEVEAENKEQAEELAVEQAEEQCDVLHNVEVTEL